jgi:hypothetical protein
MRRNKDELMRKIAELQIELGKLHHTSDVNPEKANQFHANEEAKRDQAYAQTEEENQGEIPVKGLTSEEQAEFDKRVKEYKESQKGSNSAS